ncbi:MAG: antibiotic biosynthesis monooxygenase [Saprospirales bacterium]|nr:antibiotic biosynthesis monooxygenase [Saprospirales bacterium]
MSDMMANTPEPPYYAVIFTSIRTTVEDGYSTMATRMVALASGQPGFLGVESARSEIGITVSYWADLEAIRAWKAHAEHRVAQEYGRQRWYSAYKTRICRVERDYDWSEPTG